jgi:hypothetical protein
MQIFTRVAKFTSILLLYFMPAVGSAEWKIDLSRRPELQPRAHSSSNEVRESDLNLMDQVFKSTASVQDIVIIQTDKGFIPNTVRVREGMPYRFVIVNINDKARNVSFVLDAFSEHHATFYGEHVSFEVVPKKEGTYTFMSPETAAQGRIVVHPALQKDIQVRLPASGER